MTDRTRIIRGRSSGVIRPRGRLTEWFPSADATVQVSLAAATFVLDQSLTAAELAKRPFTITRTVGSIWIASDQSAQFEVAFGAVGMTVVSSKAVATGATAVPDPITEEGSDEWFLYRSFCVSGGPVVGRPMPEFQFDSRAQRKCQDGEDIAVVVTNASASRGLVYLLKFRLLVKLS